MQGWQFVIIVFFCLYACIGTIHGYRQCRNKKNSFGLSTPYIALGAFVWADSIVFGLFWVCMSILLLFLQSWLTFLLCLGVFWTIRGMGETIYWLNQQFSPLKRNPPENLWIYKKFKKIFHQDSSWFIYQIIWQCITVGSILFTFFILRMWFLEIHA